MKTKDNISGIRAEANQGTTEHKAKQYRYFTKPVIQSSNCGSTLCLHFSSEFVRTSLCFPSRRPIIIISLFVVFFRS